MEHDEHKHLVKEVEDLFRSILTKSPQAIYIYLDDAHKTCNQKYADLLGYSSIQEWIDNEYPVSDVLEEDQGKVINAYGEASENLKASKVTATVVKKDGTKIKTDVVLAPFVYKDEVFVVHYISEIK